MRYLALTLATIALLVGLESSSAAQAPAAQPDMAEGRNRDSWYLNSGYSDQGYEKPTPLMIIQQKAQARAAARIRRIETTAAYGMSNARPTALPVPTGMYSPTWQMPGGRPHAWYTTYRPQYILWR